jgi:pullulanase/glycogen debranching enzyme
VHGAEPFCEQIIQVPLARFSSASHHHYRENPARQSVSARRDLGRLRVNVALLSENATGVELCVFDGESAERRIPVTGDALFGSEVKDLSWFRPDGKEMGDDDWSHAFTRCFGLCLAGEAIGEVDREGVPLADDTLMILVKAYHEPIDFVLPGHRRGARWDVLLDTRSAATSSAAWG